MYVCLDNEVYANTGGQKSGSTPLGASATTSPAGSVSSGKGYKKKDIMSIFAAHNAPYVAQVAPNKWKDMVAKVQRGYNTKGPVFINAMSPCTTEWRFPANKTIEVADLATDSLVFPLFEIINNRELNITYRPRNVIPVRDYLGAQQRFKHLFKKENEHIIKQFQADVDEKWDYLQRREEARV
jgi:pyruvate ferredoxin oxidoreductase beta subunit